MKSPSFRDLIVLLFLAICDARLWCLTVTYDKETSGCCNGVVYNTTTSGCCGTKIYDKSRDHIDYECCADIHVYKRYEQTCCGSVVRNNTDIDQEDVCCENKFHPKTEGVCCDNIFHKHGDKNRHSCCGKLLNDNNNKMCCNGKLHNGTKYPGQKCCGTETYNKFTHWCDERDPDIILLLGQKTCYGQKYLTKTKICCHGQLRKIIRNTPEPTRCGNKAIKETIQGCCNGAQFDLLNQICCGGTILHKSKKCCDGRELDTAKYVCCKGDKIEQQVKLQPNSDECCLLKNGSFQTFNRKYSECSLALGVAPKGSRCGTLLYNKSRDLCCQGILFKNGTLQKRKCCGVKSYDTQCQECQHDGIKDLKTCNEHVKFKETQHYCGKKEYNKDRDLCCRDKLYVNGTTQRKGCCGIKSYLKKNKKCLHGEIREGRVCPNYCKRSWIQNNQTSLTWKKNKTKMCKYKVYSISYLTGKTWEINYRKKSKNVVFEKDCRCLFKGKKEAILVSKRITKAGKIRGQFYLLPISKNNKQKTKRLIKKDIRIKNKKNISCTSKSKKKIMKEKTKSE
ncbi:usherin-like isoform X2 [Mytilus trossulus]|uniref:usherin-like isoform X2 n=1 Tax=Mytilus trossulus TaxID=6551 RepID=UPI003005BA21